MKTLPILFASLVLATAGCKKKDAEPAPAKAPAAGSAKGSATTPATGSGSATPAMTGSATGSGSADAGSAAGSGSAAAPAAGGTYALLTTLGFPNTALVAEVGQSAFAPNDSRLKSAVEGLDHEKGVLGMEIVELKEIGATESKVDQRGTTWTVPNAFIIPIAKGVTVAKGDVVTSSRYGNTIELAYVTVDGAAPKANYFETMPMDKAYEADLKPDQFIKLDGTLQPGGPVATPDETAGNWSIGRVIRVEGDQVLVSGHMGRVAVYKKDQVRPMPLKVEAKKGDKVFAVWDSAHFMEATYEKYDDKRGLHQVRLPSPFDESKQVPSGWLAPAKFE